MNLARFTRITSSGEFIPEIDGLRFIAIVWVLAFHINGELIKVNGARFPGQIETSALNAVFQTWHFGVQLFFVISGFVLGLPFLRHYWHGAPKPKLGAYYLRRLTRIEPPLIINLCVCLVLLCAVKRVPLAEKLPHFFASAFYLHNLVYGRMSTINFVTWTLEIEAQFYLLAPLLALIFRPRSFAVRWGLLTSVIVFFAALNWFITPSHPLVSMTLIGQLQYFLAGFFLAAWYSKKTLDAKSRSFVWDVMAIIAWVALNSLLLHDGLIQQIALPFAIVLGYIAIFRGRIANAIFTLAPITAIGGMCYTIYLYHPLLKSFLKRAFFRIEIPGGFWCNSIFQILALGGTVVAISALLFLVLEKPFMRRDWTRRFVARMRS
jgi:peptidoglycan/LPS O-acetylase OafA/YrhL